MTSPSVRSTRRSTPWVLGCCGPMLTSISSVRTSNSMSVWSASVRGELVRGRSAVDIQNQGSGVRGQGSVATDLAPADAMILQRELVILPQGMALPVLVQQDARQVGV